MGKRIIFGITIILILFMMVSCQNDNNENIVTTTELNTINPTISNQKENDTSQSSDILKDMSERSNEIERKFEESDIILKNMILYNEVMLEDFKNTTVAFDDNGRCDKIELFELANKWNPALNFGGFHSDVGGLLHPLFRSPDDYYMFQQMHIQGESGKKYLEHNIFFTRDYDKINMERYSLMIKGVFGIDVSSDELRQAVLTCFEKLPNVIQGEEFEKILYQENNIVIKVVAMEDVTGDKYIAICSKYTENEEHSK